MEGKGLAFSVWNLIPSLPFFLHETVLPCFILSWHDPCSHIMLLRLLLDVIAVNRVEPRGCFYYFLSSQYHSNEISSECDFVK